MSHKLTPEQLEKAKEAQKEAKELLNNKEEFDKAFDEAFDAYDKNKDGQIDVLEYMTFLQDMLSKAGRKTYDFPNTLMNFERADKDRSGNIDRAEFKKEFCKKLKEFINAKL